MKGEVSPEQKRLLNQMLKERRKKKWAEDYGIDWMDGMPLTIEHIRTFFDCDNLQEMLDDLARKGYLKLEHPKKKVDGGREQDTSLPLGYKFDVDKEAGYDLLGNTVVVPVISFVADRLLSVFQEAVSGKMRVIDNEPEINARAV